MVSRIKDTYDHWEPSDDLMQRADGGRRHDLPDSPAEEMTYGRRIVRNRHGGGPNVLYIDGHAGSMKADAMTVDLWRGQWH